MQQYKIGLFISTLLVSSLSAADTNHISWSLDSNGSEIALGDSSYRFTGNGASCKVGAITRETQEDGSITETRMLRCSNLPSKELACGKHQPESFVEFGDFRFSCTVK